MTSRGIFSIALSQNSEHALSFRDACAWYDFERIYELTLFVEPRCFSSNCNSFCDNVLVSSIPFRRKKLTEAIATEVYKNTEVMGQEDLDALASTMIQKYGDLNQKRGELHVRHMFRMSA